MGYVSLFMWPAWLYCLSLLLSPWLFGGTSTFRGLSVRDPNPNPSPSPTPNPDLNPNPKTNPNPYPNEVREHFYEFAMWLDDRDGVTAPMVRFSTWTKWHAHHMAALRSVCHAGLKPQTSSPQAQYATHTPEPRPGQRSTRERVLLLLGRDVLIHA